MKLMEHVRGLTLVDEHGRTRPLVKREGVLYQGTRPAAPEVAPDRTVGYLAGGVVLGAALAGFAALAPRRRAARYAFALLGVAWALLGGVGGAIAAYGWAVTDHTASYGNENLLQLSPLFLPLVVLLPLFAFGRRRGRRATWVIVLAIASLSALGLLLKVLPWFWQANGEIIALALPANLGLLWAVW